jgi:hypothetical protein
MYTLQKLCSQTFKVTNQNVHLNGQINTMMNAQKHCFMVHLKKYKERCCALTEVVHAIISFQAASSLDRLSYACHDQLMCITEMNTYSLIYRHMMHLSVNLVNVATRPIT